MIIKLAFFLSSHIELPVKFTKNLEEETSVLKGQPMYLNCELSKDRDVVWKKNGVEIKEIPGKIQINIIGLQRAITIQDANDDDAGVYTCECENIKTQTTVKVIGMYMIFFFYLSLVNLEPI